MKNPMENPMKKPMNKSHQNSPLILVNDSISLTWIKAIKGDDSPYIHHHLWVSVVGWGRSNLPRYIITTIWFNHILSLYNHGNPRKFQRSIPPMEAIDPAPRSWFPWWQSSAEGPLQFPGTEEGAYRPCILVGGWAIPMDNSVLIIYG